jgi:hypothetical protein
MREGALANGLRSRLYQQNTEPFKLLFISNGKEGAIASEYLQLTPAE